MNFLLRIQIPRLEEKKILFSINHKNKTQRAHQQSNIFPKYPGQKIKYLLIYHSETQRDGGMGKRCSGGIQWLEETGGYSTHVGRRILPQPAHPITPGPAWSWHVAGMGAEHRPPRQLNQIDGGCAQAVNYGWMDGRAGGFHKSYSQCGGVFDSKVPTSQPLVRGRQRQEDPRRDRRCDQIQH